MVAEETLSLIAKDKLSLSRFKASPLKIKLSGF